jgi:hypothetical protein
LAPRKMRSVISANRAKSDEVCVHIFGVRTLVRS